MRPLRRIKWMNQAKESSKHFSKNVNLSPLDPTRAIFAGAIGTEAVLGLLMPPEISLFESNAPGQATMWGAREDHRRMTNEFERHGIEVFHMRHILGQLLAERNQSKFETPEQLLRELKIRAGLLFEHYQLGDFGKAEQELNDLLRQDVSEMGPDAAVAINAVLTNCIDTKGRTKPFDIELPPAANFVFWRDTHHILGNSVGTHRMFWPIRDQEVAIARLAFDHLGVPHQELFRDSKEGDSIEGGDVEAMELNGERFALVGWAERTSWNGVKAWYEMHENLFQASGEGIIPMVVEGPHQDTQDQMHLDTFGQQMAPGVILTCQELAQQRQISVLMRKGGDIVRVDEESYAKWLQDRANNLYDMTRQEQLDYGANILCDGGNTVYVTRDGSPQLEQFIRDHVAEVVLLHMNDLTACYGGAHCTTNDIRY